MNDTIQQIYEKIESIKQELSLNEINDQLVKRQNLQDLYHQVILRYFSFNNPEYLYNSYD